MSDICSIFEYLILTLTHQLEACSPFYCLPCSFKYKGLGSLTGVIRRLSDVNAEFLLNSELVQQQQQLQELPGNKYMNYLKTLKQ